jgi:hypothetical protein
MKTRSGCGLCWSLLAIVVIVVGAAAYRLLGGGHTHMASDGRAEIVLSGENRDIVLAEMRAFLGAVQAITTALTRDDLKTVASQARSVGAAAVGQIPPSLMQALPLEFKTLGKATHAAFDQLALDAEQMGDRDMALRQLGELLNNCVSCHAAYRLTADAAQGPGRAVHGGGQ